MSRNIKVNCPKCGARVKLQKIKNGECNRCRQKRRQAMADSAFIVNYNKQPDDGWRRL